MQPPGTRSSRNSATSSSSATVCGHTGLTWIADAGVPVHVLRKIAGHADPSTTQRYLHPDRQSVASAGDLLSKHLWSQNGPKLRVV
ncbi:tyrosine-type recombinase/integrase [Mycobacterium bourgelatii]|uniref:tyrosine-type recombinase/integrase n=1 Tax=Mycobacterium bourgelatii TaxID=1273442 RepID=UPI003530BA6B